MVKQNMQQCYDFLPVDDREEAIKTHDRPSYGYFQSILAVSFLYKHNGHRIAVITDLDDEGDESEGYLEPIYYWTTDPPNVQEKP